jgi:hypothetical protein
VLHGWPRSGVPAAVEPQIARAFHAAHFVVGKVAWVLGWRDGGRGVSAWNGVVCAVGGGAGAGETTAIAWRTCPVGGYGVLLLVRGQCLKSPAVGA